MAKQKSAVDIAAEQQAREQAEVERSQPDTDAEDRQGQRLEAPRRLRRPAATGDRGRRTHPLPLPLRRHRGCTDDEHGEGAGHGEHEV